MTSGVACKESHAFVKSDGAVVICTYMQERSLAASKYVSDQDVHEATGIAVPGMVGVRTDRADLGEVGYAHTLAGHGYEFAFLAQTDVPAQFMRACAEWSGLGEFGEGKHFRIVRGREFDCIELLYGYACGFVHHLQQGGVAEHSPLR